MEVIIERAALLRPLGHMQTVVEKRTTIPILSNVLLKTLDNGISLTATDTHLNVVETAACTVNKPGEVTIAADTLFEIVRKLPEQASVSLTEESETMVRLKAGRVNFALASLRADTFPALPAEELPTRFTLQAADLRSIIDRTRFAIANEETRQYLNGLFIHATTVDDVAVLRAVATDGHRMARVEFPLPDGAENMPKVIVPRKAIGEVRKLIDDYGSGVTISLSENMLSFDCGASILTTKLVEGTFPDYQRVIPSNNNKILQVDRKALADAVDRVASIYRERSRSVKLEVGDGSLTLSANSEESGEAEEVLDAGYGEAPMQIGFNARYLLDITSQIGGEGTVIQLADSSSPAIIRDVDDESSLYVLMPMRV